MKGPLDESEIDLAVPEAPEENFCVVDIHSCSRTLGLRQKVRKNARHHKISDGKRRAERKSLHFPRSLDLAYRLIPVRLCLKCECTEPFAAKGKGENTMVISEKGAAELLFKRPDMLAYGRLCERKPRGGLGETTLFANR